MHECRSPNTSLPGSQTLCRRATLPEGQAHRQSLAAGARGHEKRKRFGCHRGRPVLFRGRERETLHRELGRESNFYVPAAVSCGLRVSKGALTHLKIVQTSKGMDRARQICTALRRAECYVTGKCASMHQQRPVLSVQASHVHFTNSFQQGKTSQCPEQLYDPTGSDSTRCNRMEAPMPRGGELGHRHLL